MSYQTMSSDIKPTPGEWNYACDSYGKVQHSKKACVYTSVREPGHGDRLVTVAHGVENWGDARLMSAAPDLLAALELCYKHLEIACVLAGTDDRHPALIAARAAIEKATR